MLSAWLLTGIVCLASCNVVREERQECPCILSVEMKGLPAYPVTLLVDGQAAGVARRDTTLNVWVEKGGMALVMAVSGAAPSDSLTVRIPYGREAPELYVYTAVADCTGEHARVAVHMHKHYCALNVRFAGPPGWGNPLTVALRGEVNGFSLENGRPLGGAFYCRLDTSSSCRLPRQDPEDPLWLDILLEDNVLRSFPLGTYLENAGYDWNAPDLSDKALDIDIRVTAIRFQTGLWSTVEKLEIVI